MRDAQEQFLLFLLSLSVIAFVLLCVGGYSTNIIWMFEHPTLQNILLGIFGAVFWPVGIVHGVMLWF